jgi:serine/threonine protein kinase/Tfp pilus assembly protein PilF
MTSEHWQRIEALYHSALEVSSEERTALLAQAEPDVRRTVEAMLAQEDSAEGVLDRPAWEQITVSSAKPFYSSEQRPTALAPGAQLGVYRIEAKLGAGGMGEVYRASDARLNREVAIKVSAAQFSERFEREAKAIAALNHPNICHIYDVGPNYLVMEYVEGAPLKGPLPPKQALKYAAQIAAALEAAHAKGIIHRDLKPANIIATSTGAVKLLDFGVAKQSGSEPADGQTQYDRIQGMGITQAGMVVGTPSYMSPEQAEGKPADARSDIFSFGTVLYELLSGRRAFTGGTTAATIGAVVHKDPDVLDAPPALEAIVRRCLAKSPDKRFQSATELRQALEASPATGVLQSRRKIVAAIALALMVIAAAGLALYLRSANARAQINSIAILPLEIRSNDRDADYIFDGITESVNNSLAQLRSLKVVPHSIALHYKGKTAESQKIGEALGVETVLTGRVAQRGDDLTIGIELDDVRSRKQLWGQQYNRKVADLLALQQDIAREVSQRLRSHLSPSDRRKLTKDATANPEAYQLYLRGQHFTSKFTKDGFNKGVSYFEQAIAKDPNYGAAYSGLANNYINQDDWFMPPKEAGPKARDAAKRALALDDSDVGAHVALAIEAQWYEWDWATAEQEFKRALELNPNSGGAHGYYSWFLASMGRVNEAVAEAERERQTDPTGSNANFTLGSVFVFTRQWDKAITQLRSAINLDSYYWFDHCFLGRAYEQKGRIEEAIEEFQRGLELDKEQAELWSGLGHAYAMSGKNAEVQEVLDHLKDLSSRSYVAPYNVAVIYAGLGDQDQTFAWLNRAYDERSYLLAVYLTTDSRLDNLHSDPRFADPSAANRAAGVR